MIHQRYHMLCLIGVCGLALVLLAGCNKKALDASVSGKAYVPPSKGGPMDVAGSSQSVGDGAGTGSGMGMAGNMGPESAGRAMPGQGPGGAGSTSSFPPLTGAGMGGRDDRNAGNIVVAKAEPSEAASRQIEQIQQEQLATALAGLNDVFFAFDSWKLTDEGKRALEQDAAWLKANPNKTLMVEGYCDERGTEAYNLVLGERRAKAAQSYLIELGVEPNRLTTVSYGKERPFCKEHQETCYQQNRRAHLVLRVQ